MSCTCTGQVCKAPASCLGRCDLPKHRCLSREDVKPKPIPKHMGWKWDAKCSPRHQLRCGWRPGHVLCPVLRDIERRDSCTPVECCGNLYRSACSKCGSKPCRNPSSQCVSLPCRNGSKPCRSPCSQCGSKPCRSPCSQCGSKPCRTPSSLCGAKPCRNSCSRHGSLPCRKPCSRCSSATKPCRKPTFNIPSIGSPSCTKPSCCPFPTVMRIMRHEGKYTIGTRPSNSNISPTEPNPLKYVLNMESDEPCGAAASYTVEAKFNDKQFEYTTSKTSFVLDLSPPEETEKCPKPC